MKQNKTKTEKKTKRTQLNRHNRNEAVELTMNLFSVFRTNLKSATAAQSMRRSCVFYKMHKNEIFRIREKHKI